ncbi:MAG: AMP-binding protein [Kineosporiaceae bacterium]|nr:AMP-binding protein [Kineosporiaceae bacterium]
MLHTWFTDAVGRFPDRVALVVEDRPSTYLELDRLSRAIAARIVRSLPARPRVGLLAARSLTAYAAYLGILRCGGVVVPLDAHYPEQRLALVAELAGLDGVVAERDQPVGAAIGRPVLRFGRAWLDETLRCGGPATDPATDREPGPDDVAYILFTSGSTGMPKGVPIRHRHLDDLVRHCLDLYRVDRDARLSQTFRLTFDPSVLDLFLAWGAGAALIVPSEDDLFDPVSFVNRHGVTHWCSVPSMITFAADSGLLTPAAMPSLRSSVFCGEQLTLRQAAMWADAAPGSTLDNAYGPTELTVLATSYRMPRERSQWPRTGNGTVPIGTPFPHLQARLGPDDELQVRGSQRFDGYVDPADDEGRFAPDDDGEVGGPVPSSAWYRTGDRVTEQDGVLVHLGRLDNQVKVMGQRVELPEVEAALRTWAGVHEAVVVLLADDAGGGVLAAAYTGESLTARQVRERLLAHLPVHMIPKRYQHLDSLPRNDRGKVDRAVCARLLGG